MPSNAHDPTSDVPAPDPTSSMPVEGLLGVPTGATIGGYRIVAKLGSGGFGTVFKAIETKGMARTVAVKILRIDRQSPNVVNHFRREMEILKELHHENIIGYLDDGEDGGRLFYVMEYVEGLPITEFADRNRLSVDERLQLFTKVGEAIEFAHRQLVVHRDLKPRNILVSTDGRREVKVLDFGIATFSDPHRMAHEGILTVSPEIGMTPEYASPEQLRGITRTSVLLDVYSLGVILFELLAGHLPHDVDRAVALAILADRIEHAKPKPPSVRIGDVVEATGPLDSESGLPSTREVTPDRIAALRGTRPDRLRRELSGELDLIALMAIRPEPERRYQRVADLLDDLTRVRGNLPIRARADSVMYRARKFGRRHRWPLAAASIACAGLVAATLGLLLWYRAAAQSAVDGRDLLQARAELAEASAAAAVARLSGVEKIADLLVEHARGFGGTFRARSEFTAMGLEYVERAFADSTFPDARVVRREATLANLMLEALADVNAPHREASKEIGEVLQRSRTAAASWKSLLAGSPTNVDVLVGMSQAQRTIARLERAAGNASGDPKTAEQSKERAVAAARLAAQAGLDAWRLRPDAVTGCAALRADTTLIEVSSIDDAISAATADLKELLASPALPGVLASSDEEGRSALLRAMSWGHVRLGELAYSASGARGPTAYACAAPGSAERSVAALDVAMRDYREALALLMRLPASERESLRTVRLLRDAHQLMCRTERELVATGTGSADDSRRSLQSFQQLAAAAWSRDPDVEESFSDISRGAELEARLAWAVGDCDLARAAFERALGALATERMLAAPNLCPVDLAAPVGAEPATIDRSGGASRLARREAIVRTDFSLLLRQVDAVDEARRQAEIAAERWTESRAAGAPQAADEKRYVDAMRDAGLLLLR